MRNIGIVVRFIISYISHNTTGILLQPTSPHTPKTKVTKLLKTNSYGQLKPFLCRRNYAELETTVAIFHNLIQTWISIRIHLDAG